MNSAVDNFSSIGLACMNERTSGFDTRIVSVFSAPYHTHGVLFQRAVRTKEDDKMRFEILDTSV